MPNSVLFLASFFLISTLSVLDTIHFLNVPQYFTPHIVSTCYLLFLEFSPSFSYFGLQNPCRWWLQPWNKKTLTPWKESYDQPRQHIKKKRHYFANKGPSSQGNGFSSGHVWMWELDYKESWRPKSWCFRTVVLEKTLESPLHCKEIQPVHPKGNQSWMFIGRIDVEAETPILWLPDDELNHLKRPWCWERLKVGGEGGNRGWDGWMASPTQWTWVWVNSCSWWWTGKRGVLQFMGCKESNMTEWLNWTELNLSYQSNYYSLRRIFVVSIMLNSCHYIAQGTIILIHDPDHDIYICV